VVGTNLEFEHHVPEIARRFDKSSVEWHDEADRLVLVHDRCHILYTASQTHTHTHTDTEYIQ